MADNGRADVRPPELRTLERVSAELGRDPMLIQGAGGNTSLKRDGVLWVKASGCWLQDAEDQPIFVPLRLSQLLDNIAAGNPDPCNGAHLPELAASALKPSIEAALHAIMPHRAVIHAHAVNCTVTAIVADGPARFAKAMGHDLHGAHIPYATPGRPLADLVRAAVEGDTRPDILLLQNHGIVVGADSPGEAATLLREVEQRLALAPRALPSPDTQALGSHENLEYRALPAASGLALDPWLFGLLTQAALTPDQCAFLGGALPAAAPGEGDSEPGDEAPALILCKGVGAFVRRDATPGTLAVIDWIVRVAERIPESSQVISLPPDEVARLIGWDAERYRLALDRSRAA